MTGLDRDTSKSPDRTGVCCTGRCAPSQCETITGPSFSSLNKPDQERAPAYRDSSGSESPSGCLLCYFFRRLGGAIWGIPAQGISRRDRTFSCLLSPLVYRIAIASRQYPGAGAARQLQVAGHGSRAISGAGPERLDARVGGLSEAPRSRRLRRARAGLGGVDQTGHVARGMPVLVHQLMGLADLVEAEGPGQAGVHLGVRDQRGHRRGLLVVR